MMSTGAITLKDKPGRGRRKSCAAGNREIRRGERAARQWSWLLKTEPLDQVKTRRAAGRIR